MPQAITLLSHLFMILFSFVEKQFNTLFFLLNEKPCEIFVCCLGYPINVLNP